MGPFIQEELLEYLSTLFLSHVFIMPQFDSFTFTGMNPLCCSTLAFMSFGVILHFGLYSKYSAKGEIVWLAGGCYMGSLCVTPV